MVFLQYFFGLIINIDVYLQIILMGLVGLMLFSRISRSRLAKGMVICLIPYLAINFFPLGRMMIVHLENHIPRPASLTQVDGIILLGGSFSLDETADRGEPVYNLAGARLFEFAELAYRYPHAKLVLTGTPLESEYGVKALKSLGIAASRIISENQATNTITNAENAYQLVKPKPHEKWLLVTSAFHMPRSYGLFRKQGWKVIPYPVNYLTPGKNPIKKFWHSAYRRTNALAWAVATKEWAGMVNHYLEGRSEHLFTSLITAPAS